MKNKVQGHESEKFLSYFNYEISYLEGGVESGFRHVEKGHKEPRLLRIFDHSISGVRTDLVELSAESLNKNDSFILDAGDELYVWNAPRSTKVKKTKALELSIKLNGENNGAKGTIVYLSNNKLFRRNEILMVLL